MRKSVLLAGLLAFFMLFAVVFANAQRGSSLLSPQPMPGKARPPGKAILISPNGSTLTPNPIYNWNAVANTTWYQLWVNDSTSGSSEIKGWYTAAQANCASGTGVCSVTSATALTNNSHVWWCIQAWNDAGYGPWSDAMTFAVVTTAGGTWLSFSEGSPGMPGDSIFVRSDSGNFHLSPAFALSGLTDGLTVTVFPSAADEDLFSVSLIINVRNATYESVSVSYFRTEWSILTKNGVQGITMNVTQAKLEEALRTINTVYFANCTLGDLDLTGLRTDWPYTWARSLDAVAIGRGQNILP